MPEYPPIILTCFDCKILSAGLNTIKIDNINYACQINVTSNDSNPIAIIRISASVYS